MRLSSRLASALAMLCAACASCPPSPPTTAAHPVPPSVEAPHAPAAPSAGDEIVICGRRVHTGTPVVLWTEPPRYDAYATAPRFAVRTDDPRARELRYRPGRVEKRPHANPASMPAPAAGGVDARAEAPRLERIPDAPRVLVGPAADDPRALAEVVDQFVLHFDACGLSRTCFAVLQDERHLSVHFLLDVDGTIYQTLDLRETAWHATKANTRSIGVEIANVGAYPPDAASPLEAWYARDGVGAYLRVPEGVKESGVRQPGFVGRPARDAPVRGRVQGGDLVQYDFTPAQYDALARLAAALCRELPRIRPDAPRDASGRVRDTALSDEEWAGFQGILGHFHVQTNKVDPGPAFDWERFLSAVRARLAERPLP